MKDIIRKMELLVDPPVPGEGAGAQPPPTPPEPPKPTTLQGEDIPEAFRGKSAKEVVDSLLMTSTELERQKAEATRLNAELEGLKKVIPQPPPTDPKEAEEKQFFSGPTDFIKKQHEERIKPLKDEYFKGMATVQKELAKTRFKDWTKYEKEIDGMLATVPLEYQTNPKLYDTLRDFARLKDLDIREKEIMAKAGYHVETGTPPPSPQAKKAELTEEQLSVAKQWGMSPEEYAKWSDNVYGD